MISPKRRNLLWLGAAGVAAFAAGIAWNFKRQPTVASSQLDHLWAASFETPSDAPMLLAALRGKPLVVNFWATWCPPCVEEMPLLDAFYRQNSAKGWQVIGLAIDQPSQVKRFLSQRPVSYPIGLAGLGGPELARALGNESGALPFTLVLYPDGRVLQSKLGKLSDADIAKWTEAAI